MNDPCTEWQQRGSIQKILPSMIYMFDTYWFDYKKSTFWRIYITITGNVNDKDEIFVIANRSPITKLADGSQ